MLHVIRFMLNACRFTVEAIMLMREGMKISIGFQKLLKKEMTRL